MLLMGWCGGDAALRECLLAVLFRGQSFADGAAAARRAGGGGAWTVARARSACRQFFDVTAEDLERMGMTVRVLFADREGCEAAAAAENWDALGAVDWAMRE